MDANEATAVAGSFPARTNPWLVFLMPFVVYMAIGSLEPRPPEDVAGAGRYAMTYSLVYTAKIVLTLAAMIFVLSGYRQFQFRISPLAIGVGIAGVFAWIALAGLQRLVMLQLNLNVAAVARNAFNPLEQLADCPAWAHAFLAIRIFGLVVVVPVVEEFFLRGFLMRYVMAAEWWKVPFGSASALAIFAGTAFPILTHPGEVLAAAVWFSAITWLMLRTKNIWDCVAAHAYERAAGGLRAGHWELVADVNRACGRTQASAMIAE